MVFPQIVSGGLLFGASYGDGTLYQNNKRPSYYRSVSIDYGLHAGVEKHGYAIFLMNPKAIKHLSNTNGWELGSAPNLTIINKGFATNTSTTTIHNSIYAFVFDQKGLMAGLRFTGTKITRLNTNR